MGSSGFNRQAFVARQPNYQRPSNPIGGLLLFLFVVVLVGAGGYYYLQSNGSFPLDLSAAASDSEVSKIAAKLDEIEKRLDRLEKRSRVRSSSDAAEEKDAETVSSETPAPAPVKGSSAGKSGGPAFENAVKPTGSAEKKDRPAANPAGNSQLKAQLNESQEKWDAATDRIADTIVELGEQRGKLAQQEQRLDKIWERFERVPVAFELAKRNGKQRVGPVSLWLRGTDQKNHRYTMRVLVDDKWIELKDRALLEPVELYMARIPAPLELVVKEIGDDQVSGVLGVPQEIPQR